MSRRRLLAAAVVLAASLVPAAPAAADHHFMRIAEVFGGAAGNPNAQFVELQMYAPNQRFVNGSGLRFLTPAGGADGTFSFTSDVFSGVDNARILAATPQAAAFFGVTPDLTIDPVMDPAGGKLEFVGKTAIVDRFSWGSYAGVHTGSGTPFPGGLPPGKSAVRDVSGGSVPGELDAGDDTGDSAADFDAALPTPTNNASQVTSRATTVSRNFDGTLRLDAAPDVANAISVSGPVDDMWKITETGAPLVLHSSAAAACMSVTVTEVRCALPEPRRVFAYVSDRDDRVTIGGPISSTVAGGTGNDKLSGGGRGDELSGEGGHDSLTGNNGDDVLIGGSGNEVLNGGTGADDLAGDAGIDTATYATRTGALVIDMDGQPDDGNSFDASGGRRDNVQIDVEWLTGGKGPDWLVGNDSANRITGGPGADELFGMGSADSLFTKGDGAADTADCGVGTDKLSYDAGLDEFPASGPGGCETATP